MKGSKLVKILTTTIFAVTLLTTVTPKEVKAEEGTCSHSHTYFFNDGSAVHKEKCADPDCGKFTGKEHVIDQETVVDGNGSTLTCYTIRCRVCNTMVTKGGHDVGSNKVCNRCHYTIDDSILEKMHLFNSSDVDKKVEKIIEEHKAEKIIEEHKEDASAKAFGGRTPDQLTLAEQKTSVSYALNALRASGNALPVNTVKTSASNSGSSDVAAVVADDRDAANQQAFAQAMCQNLGYTNVTPLKTYNMYALYATYDAKTKAQTITWANTGLKAGDSAFVVWYNQKLGKMELLPAVVGTDGTVAVSVPALGDCSTMTVVKANK